MPSHPTVCHPIAKVKVEITRNPDPARRARLDALIDRLIQQHRPVDSALAKTTDQPA